MFEDVNVQLYLKLTSVYESNLVCESNQCHLGSHEPSRIVKNTFKNDSLFSAVFISQNRKTTLLSLKTY